MNYYNPYFYTMPSATARTGLFSRLFGNFSFSGLLNGTQRALSFANQAIPFVKQVRPIIGNAKTMFKVMNEFKRSERPRNTINEVNINNNNNNISNSNYRNEMQKNSYNENGPTFFM